MNVSYPVDLLERESIFPERLFGQAPHAPEVRAPQGLHLAMRPATHGNHQQRNTQPREQHGCHLSPRPDGLHHH